MSARFITLPQSPVRVERLLRHLPIAFGVGLFIAAIVFAVTHWTLEDMDAYWNAALRLRTGDTLYPAYADTTLANVYRYAPWFAYLWVPLTYAPKAVIGFLWSVVLLAAVIASLWPLLERRTSASIAAATLLGSFLLTIASVGNVHPLLIASLVHGLERRSGPLWIAAAASLKAVPILFALVYLGRREWDKAALTVGVAILLIAPMLLFDLSNYPTDPGELSYSLYNRIPLLWVATTSILTLIGFGLAVRRSRFAWLAMSTAVVAALPRTWGYDFSFVLTGIAGRDRHER